MSKKEGEKEYRKKKFHGDKEACGETLVGRNKMRKMHWKERTRLDQSVL